MAEQPPLSRIHVAGYSANDRDFPILNLVLDPRVAGYQVPKDLSACPDKRYPNHVFTGAQPISGDQRVRHVWEILPSPWVPFTRYDDDLGPVQGRRRSVKNDGQVASLSAEKRTTYEAREGSAIVYTELEETWSIKTDEDGNSLFPIRDRDFYDASRGPVQERRQLFVPTGKERGSLENVNGVITQTSYEPYNEFLSVKIVQTYKVDGPQLIGKATDNEGQLVTITTQRKAADGYVPPSPTATRTVEASREDAESLVERIVDTPQVFGAEVYRKTREDLTPQKFKAAQEDSTIEQNVEGAASPTITLSTGEFSKSEQQINKFVKRVSTTSRAISEAVTLVEKVITNEGQVGTRTLNLQAGDQSLTPSATTIDGSVEALGDGRTVKSETIVPNVFSGKSVVKTKVDLTPEKFRAAQQDTTTEESIEGVVNPSVSLGTGEFRKSEQQVTEFVKRISTTSRDVSASTDLTETVITPRGQVATRTLRLSAQTQSIQPDALLVDGSIEALGDGRTIKTETRVGEVFEGKTLSLEKPDVTPQKFRAVIPSTSVERTIAGTVNDPITLSGNEISKSEQQETEFVKRVRTTERDPAAEATITGAKVYTSELGGGIANVIETYSSSGNITADLNTVSASSEALGDGKFVGQKVELPSIPTLFGQEYDELLDTAVPYTQTVVSTLSAVPETLELGVDLVPRNNLQTTKRTVDKTKARTLLSSIHNVFGSTVGVNLPDKLISVKVIASYNTASAWIQSDLKIASGTKVTFNGYGTIAATGDLVYEIEQGFNGPVEADRHIFYMDQASATLTNVLNKINTKYQSGVGLGLAQAYPMIRPKAHTIVVSGGTVELSGGILVNGRGVGEDSPLAEVTPDLNEDFSGSVNTSTNVIPPTLHEEITIERETITVAEIASSNTVPDKFTKQALINKINIAISSNDLLVVGSDSILKATTPPSFAAGRYLVQIDTEPYRFGMVRVSAVVANISSTYL